MKKGIIILSFLATIFSFTAGGQIKDQLQPENRCMQILTYADELYAGGLYEECIDTLDYALNYCSLTRKEREHAMELKAKSLSEIPDPVQADGAVEAMLKKFPHYELNESRNFESYNRIVRKYRIHPALSLGARNAALWRKFRTTKVYSLEGGPDNSGEYYSKGYGFTYYGWGEIEFDRGISINGDLMWWTSGFSRDVKGAKNVDLNYWEWEEFVEIPVYIKKYFYLPKNFIPYVAAGAGWLYMTKASGNVNNYNETDDLIYIINNVDVIGMRNRNNFEWIGGAGIGYKLKNLRFFIEARYYGGLTSLTNSAHRMDNQTLINDYSYLDNSVRMNKFEAGAAISYTFINSVKKINH